LFAIFARKEIYESLQFLQTKIYMKVGSFCRKNCKLSNKLCWIFLDIKHSVLNHFKFFVYFYLSFCTYLWICFHLKRLNFYFVTLNYDIKLLETMMWKLFTMSLMCKVVRIGDKKKLSSLMNPYSSIVARVVRAYRSTMCVMFI